MKSTGTCPTCDGLGTVELLRSSSLCGRCEGYGVVDVCRGCGADFSPEDEALNSFAICYSCEMFELSQTVVN